MLTKHLFIIFAIFGSVSAMEMNDRTVQMDIDSPEILKRKVATILKGRDSTTQSIIKDLLTRAPTKASSQQQLEQKDIILRKITESDE